MDTGNQWGVSLPIRPALWWRPEDARYTTGLYWALLTMPFLLVSIRITGAVLGVPGPDLGYNHIVRDGAGLEAFDTDG